jgi:hypothetical protein
MDLSGANKRKRVHKKSAQKDAVKKQADENVVSHQININIALPKSWSFRRVWSKLKGLLDRSTVAIRRFIPSKKILNITLATVIIVSSLFLFKSFTVDTKLNENTDEVKGIEAKKNEKPDFVIYYPTNEKTKEMSYDANKKVASYPDQIDTIPITISQQKLPDTFKANPIVELEKLAKQINANTKLEAVGGINAFMGQSVRGPQTVVFVKDQTLIFIKSDSQVAISAWNNYLDTLTLQK